MARLLVIDDDVQFRTMLRRTLERAGHEVVEAEDGAEGVRAFAARPADLAIVDLYLPGRSGWDTIRELRERAGALPFVVVTGGAAMEAVAPGGVSTLESLRATDAVRLLRKPFERATLLEAVDGLLSPRRTVDGGG